MKRIITTMATLIALALSISASAKPPVNPLRTHNAKKIALAYVEALTTGNITLNKFLFADNFAYENSANNQVSSKNAYLNFLKDTQGLQYNCKTTYEILDQTGPTAIAKAIMQFENFTRVDYITIQQTEDGWKVNKVVTTYP